MFKIARIAFVKNPRSFRNFGKFNAFYRFQKNGDFAHTILL
ncbi:hypothetical protein LEP1GSC036_3171 [Leptospira weilii str. 2006001853]|uniref:Uncharacterized protein n=3 Tax=Leptospira weilii TaxID=28184 RepID=A0A828YYD1_9LEPT|nr:hypothetical protein LEP1GSC036_3171 [Leptospira weilii str. 2006001853]EMM72387.1 hypothetical protein LEP1GSC038_3352 [Leptospira weilii str. 2006001855]EMY15897.1 hypothetical protein LEP1GSC043_2170 [Leptospira weilii str. Ecochallenge]